MPRPTVFALLLGAGLCANPAQAQMQSSFETVILRDVPAVSRGAVAWGDADADGDLDLLVAGFDAAGTPITGVWRFELDASEFDEAGGSVIEVSRHSPMLRLGADVAVVRGAALWVDLDANGYDEAVVAGIDAAGATRLHVLGYRTDAGGEPLGAFDHLATLDGLVGGALDAGDLDGDGREDVVACGTDADGASRTWWYPNRTGGLGAPQALEGVPGVGACGIALGDADGDGDADLALSGQAADGTTAGVFLNTGGGAFVDAGIDLAPRLQASLDWGDADGDGDLDLALQGARLSPFVLEGDLLIYRQAGGAFTLAFRAEQGVYDGALAWGDPDGDGALALISAGANRALSVDRRAPLLFFNASTDAFETHSLDGSGAGADATWGDYDGDGDADYIVIGTNRLGAPFIRQSRNRRLLPPPE